MELNTVLTDLLVNTPFVGFLIWQYVQMRKDYKEQQGKMDSLRREALEREEQIRVRFEKVITDLNSDKDQLVTGLEKRLTQVETKIDQFENQIKKLFSLLNKIQNALVQRVK
jgi:predicted nuclease with TOPRIM domain